MIPAGYIDGLVSWATRPDLSTEDKAARQTQLLDEQDALVTGQLSKGKSSRSLTQGGLNGKTFTWNVDLSAPEKLAVITAVLVQLGLSTPTRPSGSYANFQDLRR